MELNNFRIIKNNPITINDKFILECGSHYVFDELTIEKKGTLNLQSNEESDLWWNKQLNKWVIIETIGNLYLKGKINAIDLPFPGKEEIIIEDSIVFSFQDFKEYAETTSTGKEIFKLEHHYKFNKGGNGGRATSGPDIENHPLPIPQGAEGTIFYGGGGGGGVGFVHAYVDNGMRDYNVAGGGAKQNFGGEPGVGTISDINGLLHPSYGGKGGNGGLTPKKGVGGLIVIICHGTIFCQGGIVNIYGANGCDGINGDPSGYVPALLSYPPNGAGGGGAGSPGLPGGKLYLFASKIEGDLKVDSHGGFGGKKGIKGSDKYTGGFIDYGASDATEAENGQSGAKWINGDMKQHWVKL
jgi:hypothetical protein